MDFVTSWKAVSIVLTGAFGVLGLIKEFKNKETGRITKWGGVSLAGILVSTTLGVFAQLRESSDQQKAREATAGETLRLAKNTDQTVQDLQRVLSSLEEPRVTLIFHLNCDEPMYKNFCVAVAKTSKYYPYPPDREVPDVGTWKRWPNGPKVTIAVDACLFRDSDAADCFLEGSEVEPDLWFSVHGNNSGDKEEIIEIYRDDPFEPKAPSLFVHVTDNSPRIETNSGKIASISDLSGATVVLEEAYDFGIPVLEGLTPVQIEVKNKRGESISAQIFEKTTVSNITAYRAIFPKR